MEQGKADPGSAPEPDVAFPSHKKCEELIWTPLSGAVRGAPLGAWTKTSCHFLNEVYEMFKGYGEFFWRSYWLLMDLNNHKMRQSQFGRRVSVQGVHLGSHHGALSCFPRHWVPEGDEASPEGSGFCFSSCQLLGLLSHCLQLPSFLIRNFWCSKNPRMCFSSSL